MDDLNEQIEKLRQNRGQLERHERYIMDNDDDESQADELPQRVEGVGGVFTFQMILALIIAISYILIITFAAPVGREILSLIKDKSENDFVFKDKVYDSVGTFLTYINEQSPIQNQDGNGSESMSSLPVEGGVASDIQSDDVDAVPNGEQSSASETTSSEGGQVAAGGVFTPVLDNEVPANATLSEVKISGKMMFPLKCNYWISSSYGFRDHPSTGVAEFHTAADIAAEKGEAVYASAKGTVISCGKDESLGNFVWLDHGDGFYTVYGHCDSINVKLGQSVRKGEAIAKVGSTGDSTGNHLHFGMKKDGIYFNPGYVFKELL